MIDKKRFIGGAFGAVLLALQSPIAMASNAAFQSYLFSVCTRASGDLAARCAESNGGDLSGDSEDSLNPTQFLTPAASALKETREQIEALSGRKAVVSTGGEQSVKKVFRLSGWSFSAGVERGDYEREAVAAERGFEAQTDQFYLGADYRLNDAWIVGAIGSVVNRQSRFAADAPGRNFQPGDSEGRGDVNTAGISAFVSYQPPSGWYFDALLSAAHSDYRFRRVGIYQESTRTITLNRNVVVSGDSEGRQYAASTSLGYNDSNGALNWTLYVRADWLSARINAYEESGDAFAMGVDHRRSEEILAETGVQVAMPINTAFAVWVPQLAVAFQDTLASDTPTASSYFLADTAQQRFLLRGRDVDESRWRFDLSLQAVFPGDWSAFVGVTSVKGDVYSDEWRLSGGLRRAF